MKTLIKSYSNPTLVTIIQDHLAMEGHKGSYSQKMEESLEQPREESGWQF